MEREQIIAMWILYRRYRRQKKKSRNYWVHPINLKREQCGAFYILFPDLLKDEDRFFTYLRMSISSFNQLHDSLKNQLQRENSKMRNCIQPIEMLVIAIR